jgi:hypothetical protein
MLRPISEASNTLEASVFQALKFKNLIALCVFFDIKFKVLK